MSELTPQAQAIIDAASGADSPTPADRDRVRMALFAQIGLAAAGTTSAAAATSVSAPGAATSLPGAAAGSTKLALATKVLAGLILVGGIGVGGYLWSQRDTSEPSAPVASITAPNPAEVTPIEIAEDEPVALDEAEPEPEPEIDIEPEVIPAKKPAPRRVVRKKTAPPEKVEAPAPTSDPLATLRAEKELISGAKRALDGGDAKLALTLLAKHAAKFERGILAQDRAGLRVLALCAKGEVDRARQEADAFLERWPRASMAQRVRNACK